MTVLPLTLLAMSLISMGSPWWEDYGITEQFLCPDQRRVTLERNESQASLIAGRFRSTLFREASDQPGIRYRNEQMTLTLRGDMLTMEQLSRRLECMRTEQV
ncbi:MAG: hypothetical protein WD136_00765 [Cyanobium sp.]